jgi:hypothetical protein
MPSRREILKWAAGAAAAGAGLPLGFANAEGGAALALVVSKASPIQALSQFELKKLYLGSNINDPSGERILAFNQAPNSPDRVAFEQRVLGMSPEEVARYWIDRKIRGEGGAPKAVGSVELLQRVVSKMEHSVAYVRVDQVRPEVRIVAIDGAVPGDPAYRLFA